MSRRRIDLIGRKDHGDEVKVHEFDFSKRDQVVYHRKVSTFSQAMAGACVHPHLCLRL